MYAQEAIRTTEERIRILETKAETIEGVTVRKPSHLIRQEIKALSIVLESAKLLHALIQNNEAMIEGDQLGVYPDFAVHIPEDKAEQIGVPPDDN